MDLWSNYVRFYDLLDLLPNSEHPGLDRSCLYYESWYDLGGDARLRLNELRLCICELVLQCCRIPLRYHLHYHADPDASKDEVKHDYVRMNPKILHHYFLVNFFLFLKFGNNRLCFVQTRTFFQVFICITKFRWERIGALTYSV